MDKAPTRSEIAKRLHTLADDMIDVAAEMDFYGGMAVWAQHAQELLGAGHLARSWAAEIENQAHNAIPLTDPGCSGCWRQREESPIDQIPDARGA